MLAALTMLAPAADAGPRHRSLGPVHLPRREPARLERSIMTAPDVKGRLKAIRIAGAASSSSIRGARDRDKADRHLFIRPAPMRSAARDDPRAVRRQPRQAGPLGVTASTSCAPRSRVDARARGADHGIAARTSASSRPRSRPRRARCSTPDRRVRAGVRRARRVAVLRGQRVDRAPRRAGRLMFTTPRSIRYRSRRCSA